MHLKWKILLLLIWNGIASLLFVTGIFSILGAVMFAISGLYINFKVVQTLIWKPFKNYIIICAKIDLYFIYMSVRLPIWLFIQLPLYYLFTGSHKIEEFFQTGLSYFTNQPKKTAVATLPGIAMILFLFPPRYLDPLAAESWSNYAVTIFILMVGAFASGFILMKLYDKLTDGQIARKSMPGSAVDSPGEALHGTKQRYKNWKQQQGQQVRETGQAAARNAHRAKKAKDTAEDVHFLVDGFAHILRLLGFSVGSLEAGVIILLGLVVVLGIMLAQFIVVMAIFIFAVKAIIPLVAAPLLEAMGLGQAYAGFFGESLADQYAVGVVPDLGMEKYVAMYSEAKQRVFCLFKGPECLMAWRMNQSQRPDAQDVGENYELKIENFQVGSGSQVDVAYQPKSYEVPLSFSLYNTIRGFDGIPAHNVSYRVKMIDFDNPEEDPYCDTGWVPVDGFTLREPPPGKDDAYYGNDLPPGAQATTQFLRLSEEDTPGDGFTLEDCGMLQPGIQEFRKAKLFVKYDYSSSAHLYFEAKAREAADPAEKKNGKTTDTPVKIETSIQSPITYSQRQLQENRRNPGEAVQPRTAQISFDTQKDKLKYQIDSFNVRKPRKTCIFDQDNGRCASDEKLESLGEGSDSSLSCVFAPKSPGSNEMIPTDRAKKNFIAPYKGSDRPADFWFTRQRPPSFMGCPLGLNDPASVNPEGESLYMRARANYTVQLWKPLEGFKVFNSRCRTQNCPFLVPESLVPSDMDENASKHILHKCKGAMGQDGCSVGNPGDDWTSVDDITVEKQVSEGETVFTWTDQGEGKLKQGLKKKITVNKDFVKDETDFGEGPNGLGVRMEDIEADRGKALVQRSSGLKLEKVEQGLCYFKDGKKYASDNLEKFRELWAKNQDLSPSDVKYFSPVIEKCKLGTRDGGARGSQPIPEQEVSCEQGLAVSLGEEVREYECYP